MVANTISQSDLVRLISSRFSVKSPAEPVNVRPSQVPFIAEVKSKLGNGEYRFERYPCPCNDSEGQIISEVDRYGLPLNFVLCRSCGTIRINPYLDEQSLADFYTRFFQQMYGRAPDIDAYFSNQEKLGEKVLDLAQRWLKPGSCVYEVGCGAGGALKVFERRGYLVAGCDYSAELIAAGTGRGVTNIYHGSLKDIPPRLHGAKADLIYLNHVFEHMNYPQEFLKECKSHLADQGRILIIVPDVSRIDSFNCPAGDLLQFLHIAHKYNFSFEGLCRLSAHAGYRVRRLTPNTGLQTSHSIMPELWIELTTDKEASPAKVKHSNRGNEMLQYLIRTEKLYSLGLCQAQLLQKINGGKTSLEANLARLRRATPAKVFRKIKGR